MSAEPRAPEPELLREPVVTAPPDGALDASALVGEQPAPRPSGARWRALRRLLGPAAAVAMLTFLNAAAWALITPAFEGPDEEQHAAYAAQLAETGHPPTANATRSFASTDMRIALDATHHYSVFLAAGATRPPWLARDQRAYDQLVAQHHPRRDDGGGETGASGYGPAYYALAAVGYDVAGGSFFSRLFGMRLISALLASLTVLCVYLTVRELLPRHRWAAVAGALAVGFQPMFGYVSGVVNNDAAANLAGAALLLLVVRAMRRGLGVRGALAIGAVLVAGVVAKTTVLALVPAVAVGLVIAARRRRVQPAAWLALGATLAGAFAIWAITAHALGRALLPSTGLQSSVGPAGHGASVTLLDRLAYVWQIFLPPLPGMHHIYSGPDVVPAWTIYVQRVWGSFGWLSIQFSRKVYELILLVGVVGLGLCVRTALRERAAVRARAGEVVVLVLGLLGLMAAMHYAFARATPSAQMLEQGRYLFPAITLLAVAGVGACFGLGRRLAPVGAVALVGGMVVLSVASQLFVFTSYYT